MLYIWDIRNNKPVNGMMSTQISGDSIDYKN